MHEMEGPYALPGTSHGLHQMITYQPAGRFRAFQGVGAGTVIVLSGILIALACRLVLTRDP
jgi:hypothetical protein